MHHRRQGVQQVLDRHRPFLAHRGSQRGETRAHWGRGPWEQPRSWISLFVDHLPTGASSEWIGEIFAAFGEVVDLFISRKSRPVCKDTFGFVRFQRLSEAEAAMNKMDGVLVKGKRIRVSMAKYDKAGRSFPTTVPANANANQNANGGESRRIMTPSFRDQRNYADVVMGKPKPVLEQEEGSINSLIDVNVRENLMSTEQQVCDRVVGVRTAATPPYDVALTLSASSVITDKLERRSHWPRRQMIRLYVSRH